MYSSPQPFFTSPLPLENYEVESQPISNDAQQEKKTAKIACAYCNKLHKKCDGDGGPCSRCKKKGQPCVYMTPQKRGPKAQTQESQQKRKKRKETTAIASSSSQSFSPQESSSPTTILQAPMPLNTNLQSPPTTSVLLTPTPPNLFTPSSSSTPQPQLQQQQYSAPHINTNFKEHSDETQMLQLLSNTVNHFQQKFSTPPSSSTPTPLISPVQLELDKLQQHLNLSDAKMKIIQSFIMNVDCFSIITIPLVKQFITSSQSNIHNFIMLENSQLSPEETPIPIEMSNYGSETVVQESIEVISLSQLLLYYAILAKSLQKMGSYDKSTEYYEKAKALSSKVLLNVDRMPNVFLCTAMLVLMVHAVGLGDSFKADLFISIGLQLADTLKDPILLNVSSSLYLCLQMTKCLATNGYMSLNLIALQPRTKSNSPILMDQNNEAFSRNPPCECECSTSALPLESSTLFHSSLQEWLRTLETYVETKNFPIEIVDVGVFAILTKYVVDIASCKNKASQANQSVNLNLLAYINSKLDTVSSFVEGSPLLQTDYYKHLLSLHKFLIFSVRGLISAEIGMDQLTKFYVESAIGLAKNVRSNQWPPIILFFIPLLIICSAQLNDSQLFSQTTAILHQFRKVYPVANYSYDTLAQKFSTLIL